MSSNFQKQLISEVRTFLQPILGTRGDPEAILALLEMFGWNLRAGPSSGVQSFTTAFQALTAVVGDFVDNPDGEIDSFDDLRDALADVVDLVTSMQDLAQNLPSPPPSVTASDFGGDLLNGLSVLYLYDRFPLIFAILRLLTIIRFEQLGFEPPIGTIYRVTNKFARLRLDRLGALIGDTPGTLKHAYWPNGIPTQGEANAVAGRLFPPIVELLNRVSLDAPISAAYGRGVGPNSLTVDREDRLESMLSAWWTAPTTNSGLTVRVGASVGLLPDAGDGPGASILPFGSLDFQHPMRGWLVAASGSYQAQGFAITKTGLTYLGGTGPVPNLSLVLAPEQKAGPALLIGSATGTRLEAKQFWFEANAVFSSPKFEVSAYMRLKEAALVVGGGDGDGFLKKILPPEGLRVDFDLGVGWSNLRGFHIEGSGTFEFRVPLHLSLGPIEIPGLTLRMGFDDGAIPISLGCDVRATLGPLTAVVENMGVRLDVTFPEGGGNLGPLNWSPAFKPPSGIGLAIDGGGFSGGGFISFEPELDRYAGLLELEFQSGFALKALGLLNTKLPGNVPGYSLLIIISAEFSPIQLSFGFTLNGVGGLLGLNRTTDIDALRAGVKTGALNSILFPVDIVANASQIISDLRAIFPPAADRFIFGPMAKIGWGTPTLVEIELGLMVEGMNPWRILLPGVVRLVLPSKDNAILKLQVNFLGTWEQDKKTITFYASLFDSSILSMVLTGDMAFLMTYGADASFLVSAGGFNPSFLPPPLPFPPLARMTLIIRNESSLRIILSSYFAVTSNTSQIGCSASLWAEHGNYSIDGYLGFDALFQFSPFHMTVDFAATMTLRRKGKVEFGVAVYANLSGPAPWSVHGTASFTILKQDITFEFSRTWGEQRDASLGSIEVFAPVADALDNLGNWEAIVPENVQNIVTLRARDATDLGLLLRPDGALCVKQKVVPLGITIGLFGNQEPATNRRFAIGNFTIGGTPVPHVAVNDEFAPAQFQHMSDAQKLSQRSFESMPAGAKFGGATLATRTSKALRRTVGYETKIVNSRTNFYYAGTLSSIASQTFSALCAGNSTSKFAGSAFNGALVANPAARVAVLAPQFAVVGVDDMRMASSGASFGSQAEARDHIDNLVANDRSLAGRYQVVPGFQARSA